MRKVRVDMFFDNASTTKIDDNIIAELKNINDEFFYNPGGLYAPGRRVKSLLEEYRKSILDNLNASGYLIFTGSASESNNLALWGVLKKNTRKILVSMGEHPSVFNVALEMKNRGYNVEFVNLNKTGSVDIDDFKNKMTSDVDIVSIMHVSNETGAINDIEYLVSIAKDINPKVIFHCDGVQAVGKIPVNIDELGVDLYTMSAHKIHGMKGVGALYVNKKILLKPIVFGGGQEQGLRSGTENILGIFTLKQAVCYAIENQSKNYNHVLMLKRKFLEKLYDSKIDFRLNSSDESSPFIVSLGFAGCRAETILNMLSDRGIYIGNGSACSSKKLGNRILENMGVDRAHIEGNIRISFSRHNTEREVDSLVENLVMVVNEYRSKV
jgi:cysteine desulfurase